MVGKNGEGERRATMAKAEPVSARSRSPKFSILDDIEVSEKEIASWQNTVDILLRIADVPAALVMRVHADEIEVLVSSRGAGNIYHQGEKAALDLGRHVPSPMLVAELVLLAKGGSRNWKRSGNAEQHDPSGSAFLLLVDLGQAPAQSADSLQGSDGKVEGAWIR
jgi:hypothetical protein